MRRFGLILITSILTAVAATAWAQVDDGLIAYWSFDACNFVLDATYTLGRLHPLRT